MVHKTVGNFYVLTVDFDDVAPKKLGKLILIELLKGKRKLREISTDLKITPQGASVYLKRSSSCVFPLQLFAHLDSF